MSVQAKVAPAGDAVSSGVEKVIIDGITLAPGDNIALALSPDMIGGYSHQGADLLIQLKTGETIRIGNLGTSINLAF
ncbi:MAG: hypothetical protein QHC67_18690 [Sphingobium sp.]|uniref:hypothetical protein n=1 Tax=Sphingobium sp. TaxID=1912891 RepID=UPI0029A4EB42|nr:hypothetical protein [Sphingobium sp.]MDX3911800.1 hypothetical protein [Sphingobium sp.]